MKPSRALQIISLSWLFLGFVSVAALTLLIRFMPKMEWRLSTNTPATSTAQEVPGSALYRGMPVGQDELFAWIYEIDRQEEREARKLAAYEAGRLQTGPRLISPSGKFYVQLVNTGDPGLYTADPSCGYYGSACDVIAGGEYHMMGWPVILTSSGQGGSHPIGFTDEDHIVLASGFGDGPCGSSGYALFDVNATTTTHSLLVSECSWAADPVSSIAFDDRVLSFATEAVFLNKASDVRTLFTTVRSNGKDLLRIRRSSENLPRLLDSLVTDPKQFLADPKQLEVRLENKTYQFRVTQTGFELVR